MNTPAQQPAYPQPGDLSRIRECLERGNDPLIRAAAYIAILARHGMTHEQLGRFQ